MVEAFDPYHKWLGIPPEEQPPDHYRLLGLRRFEDDLDVIESAVDQRMAHLRTYQAGKHSALSQKLLNEVAAAKVCLLNPEKRAKYDASLEEYDVQEPAATEDGPAVAGSAAAFDLDRLGLSDGQPLSVPDAGGAHSGIGKRTGGPATSHKEARRRPLAPWWALGALAGVAAIAVGLIIHSAPRNDTATQSPEGDAAVAAADSGAAVSTPAGPQKTAEETKGQRGSTPDKAPATTDAGGVAKPGPKTPDPASPQPASPKPAPPVLLTPAAGAELPNRNTPSGGIKWQFRWSPVPKATQYKFWVRIFKDVKVISVPVPSVLFESSQGVSDAIRLGWGWKVQAMVDGQWTDWSEERAFDVQSAPSGTAAPPPLVVTPSVGPPETAPATPAAEKADDATKKHTVPDAAAQEKALALIREVFADEQQKAKTAQERLALARKMIGQAEETHNDDAACWVLLDRARRVAAKAGSAEVAINAAQQKAAMFDVDPVDDEAESIEVVLKLKGPGEQRRANIEAMLGAVDKLAVDDKFEAAAKLATAVRDAARTAAETGLARQFDTLAKEIQHRQEEYADVAQARDVLKTKPDDPEANLAVGKYVCFAKKDWEKGLPQLAKGSDQPLREIAKLDVANPADGSDQLHVADGWYDLGKKDSAKGNATYLERAKHWYEQSLANVTGLEHTKAEKRIEELGRLGDSKGKKDLSPAAKAAAAKVVDTTPRQGVIFCACASSYMMYINGESPASGSSFGDQRTHEFKSGDVITVRVFSGSSFARSRGFACVIIIEAPKTGTKRKRVPLVYVTGPESTGWHSYLPKDSMEWYKPENIGQKGVPFGAQSTVCQAVSKASNVNCMSILGSAGTGYSYLTLTVNFGK